MSLVRPKTDSIATNIAIVLLHPEVFHERRTAVLAYLRDIETWWVRKEESGDLQLSYAFLYAVLNELVLLSLLSCTQPMA